jgi:hypothetical protein
MVVFLERWAEKFWNGAGDAQPLPAGCVPSILR